MKSRTLNNRFIALLLLPLFAFSCQQATQPSTANAKAQVKEIADAAWQDALAENLSLRLRHQQPIKEFPDITLQQAEKEASAARALIARIDAVPQQNLDHEDALTLAILRWKSQTSIEAPTYHWLTFAVTPYTAGWQHFGTMHRVFAVHPFKSEPDLANYLTLTDEYIAYLDQSLDKLKQQEAKGIRLPKPAIPGVLNLFTAHRGNTDKLFSVAPARLEKLDAKAVSEFQTKLQATIKDKINPAFDRVLAFLKGDYQQRAPETVGLAQYPEGKEFYRYLVRLHTTSDLTPEQVHEIGLKRVAELSAQMQQIRDSLGFKGTQAEFHQMLRTNPKFLAKTPADVEARYMGYIRRIEPLISRYFVVTPKAPYGVTRLAAASEATMTFGFYQQPTPENPKGEYHYNGSKLEDRSLVMAGPLIYHELIPGHHFHIASQNENTALHIVRREFTQAGAFTEGWGNYAAVLAAEAGMLDDPYDKYGSAIFDMFVAVRLVVDTGMNYFGWSLERARAFMKEHAFQSETEINSESLRYSTDLPGQALGYKIGVEKFKDLRTHAKAALGDKFDIRAFHQAVLGSGAMPMSVLEKHIDWFIEQERKR